MLLEKGRLDVENFISSWSREVINIGYSLF